LVAAEGRAKKICVICGFSNSFTACPLRKLVKKTRGCALAVQG
jgi:hypothetical protein